MNDSIHELRLLGKVFYDFKLTRKELAENIVSGLCYVSDLCIFDLKSNTSNTFYAPPNPFVLEAYAQHLPAGFKCVSKVWEELTVPKWSNQNRYGKKAGKDNPHFLDAEFAVLAVYEATFKEHTGPFVFEFGEMFPPVVPALAFFLEKLEHFFANLPAEYQYGVELRNKHFLKPEYFAMCRRQ